VGAYAGLAPRRYQSGESDRSGRISKAGSGRLRNLLEQVAWGMLRYNPRGREVFDRLCKNHKTRRKQAAVALARRPRCAGKAAAGGRNDFAAAVEEGDGR
jgi:transposase